MAVLEEQSSDIRCPAVLEQCQGQSRECVRDAGIWVWPVSREIACRQLRVSSKIEPKEDRYPI